MVLTKAGSILGPIATVLGYVMDILFRFTSSFGVFNVGLCIILFTIVMKTLMIPLTIKQQKTTKLMSVMNPEIQAIQKKYKGKSDQESMQRQNVEIQATEIEIYGSADPGCLREVRHKHDRRMPSTADPDADPSCTVPCHLQYSGIRSVCPRLFRQRCHSVDGTG